jgi:N-acetylglucosamine-6-phosphate deacetylase
MQSKPIKHGLIDPHLHGYAGLDAQSDNPHELLLLSQTLACQGLAGFLLTYVSAPRTSILRSLKAAQKTMGQEKGASILGVHLEGPFLNPERSGAHLQSALRNPSLAEVREWMAVGPNLIKVVTLSPELPGAEKVIRYLASQNVRVQMGHTTATATQARKAKQWGVTGVTHLFNAMGPRNRRDASLADFVLEDQDLYTELIIDGVHVSYDLLSFTLKKRPLNRILFVSDCCAASGFPTGHRASFAGAPVITVPDGSLRRKDGTLAASGLLLPLSFTKLAQKLRLSINEVQRLSNAQPLQYFIDS